MSFNILRREDYIPDIHDNYVLCYIDSISETIWDYTEDSKKYMSSPGYNAQDEYLKWGRWNPHIHTEEVPNPEYKEGVSEYYAYFTPIPIKDQWGDDWNDSPYEHNAGIPYDHMPDDHNSKIEILKIPFGITNPHAYVRFPESYGCGNSHWSVLDINSGAIAWIYASGRNYQSVSIQAGVNIGEFFYLMNKIEKL